MKLTIDIPDDLLREVEAIASATSTTLDSFAVAALRGAVASKDTATINEAPPASRPIEILAFEGEGLEPGLPANFIEKIRYWAYADEAPG